MEIPSKYNPLVTEEKWYKFWIENNLFRSVPDERPSYCIVIPPPNVTGVLHMGHMLNNTLQDVLVRRARMQGKNALWLPGTDHASIATEAKVVAKLKEKGIEKSSISRDEFLEHAWEWKEKHGGIILDQLKRLGASCDWSRTRFTMDHELYESVVHVFIDLFNKGLIYRGVRMVNWDPKALTALSDEEVNYKEVKSKLYYVKYKICGQENEYITVATTRPETILGDTAICFNPEDERFRHLAGKKVFVPLLNREIPVIQDSYVDMEFGTGCLKITPAHDINDYKIGIDHHLEVIDIFNDDGTLSEKAGLYIGMDRFKVRDLIIKDLEQNGHIAKIEDYTNKVGYSERTDVPIEPKLSMQWFVKMESLAKPALDVVMNDTIHFHPAKFKNTYSHWMMNVKDWCISRQLWWGHRIPAYYTPDNELLVAQNKEEALKMAHEKGHTRLTLNDLRQDEDVLDTWFSSWLWPISVFDGIRHPDNEDIKYYYPTDDLVTAPEILFFWVARMIIAGLEYAGDIPFKNVYLTGIVRDKLGRKMSKSLGNSADPIEMMDTFGADGVRVGMLLTSPAGNDLPFDEALCEQGRNFSNKIWNALRLIKSWKTDKSAPQPAYAKISAVWFESKLNDTISQVEDHFSKYRISDALMTLYKLVWDNFCSWYLEMIKPPYNEPVDQLTYDMTVEYFEKLVKLLHPFMPFITEELWHRLDTREDNSSVMNERLPVSGRIDKNIIDHFDEAEKVITLVRSTRKSHNIPFRDPIDLYYKTDNGSRNHYFDPIISKLCNIGEFRETREKIGNAESFIVKSCEYFIPHSSTIDTAAEIEKIKAEIEYFEGFLKSIEAKLQNERFFQNAPKQVLDKEIQKKNDTEGRINILKQKLDIMK